MAGSRGQVVERRPNLALAFQELLTATARLRFNRQTVSDADAFKAHTWEGLRAAVQEGISRGYAADDVKIAAFAVVAFLDESILNLRNPVFARWSGQSLQAELSGKHLAGNEFFDYIQQLLGRRDSQEVADILEVFDLCLLLGYRGRYGLSGIGDLGVIMRDVRDKIARSRGGNGLLSPSATLPLDPPTPRSTDRRLRQLTIGVIAAAALAIIIFALCKILLISGSSELHSLAGG